MSPTAWRQDPGLVFIGKRVILDLQECLLMKPSMKPSMKMTESSSLFQDKPSHVEKPGARPGSLSPPLGRHREPGA